MNAKKIPKELELYENLESMDASTKVIIPLKERRSGESTLLYNKKEQNDMETN